MSLEAMVGAVVGLILLAIGAYLQFGAKEPPFLDYGPPPPPPRLGPAPGAETYRYGGEGTIHQTEHVNVEVGLGGQVVAVWFRCHPLPFVARDANADRVNDMRFMYRDPPSPIVAIEFGKRER